ncbi:hypothetical protein Pcinc_021263 [Petrolisthes cinctipes]|uniref:Uncharacterized protein n=1 Tax=Petrolisthes cinctipes TaxID=88211 RepID=A0AAE1KFB7_PETCI|nr:hypothetical protein Pcinc_021263 [Petrolisthes cinctipes]
MLPSKDAPRTVVCLFAQRKSSTPSPRWSSAPTGTPRRLDLWLVRCRHSPSRLSGPLGVGVTKTKREKVYPQPRSSSLGLAYIDVISHAHGLVYEQERGVTVFER